MNLYGVIYTMVDVEASNAQRPAHVEFLKGLLHEKKIVDGWKFPRYEPTAIQGILFCQAESKEQVAAWFQEDPVIKVGARTFEVREAERMAIHA